MVTALASLTLALAILTWAGRPLGIALAGLALAGLASSLGFASIIALVGRAAPVAPAAALGLVSLVATWSVIAGAPLVGSLYQRSGDFTAPLAVFAALPAAALVLSLGLPRDPPPRT